MKFSSFEELLINELQELYSAETQIVEVLPKVASVTSSPELKDAFKKYLVETKQQVKRLETALESLQADTTGETSTAMEGLIDSATKVIQSQAPAVLKDAAIIGIVQKIKHYMISGYGTAKAHAKILEMSEIVDLLDDTQKEKVTADKKLTKIAEGTMFTSGVNKQATR